MIRILKWTAAVVGVVLLLLFVVYLASRATRTSNAEQKAVAMIDAAPVREGRDGFADLYTVAHDVPQAKRARLLAEDVRRFASLPPMATEGSDARLWRSALEDWPSLYQTQADDPVWCPSREAGCLQRVRAAQPAYAGLLERNAALLDRAASLSAWGHFANPFPPRLDMPLPAYQSLTRLATRSAWRFANGDIDAGLAGACAGVAQGRTLILGGENLIGSMVGAALIQGNASLLADMLAELPRNHVLPAGCEAAFVLPMPAQVGICRTMLGEARFVAGGLRTQVTAPMAGDVMGENLPRWLSPLFFDPERTLARMAPKFAWYCGEQARALLQQDRPLLDPTPPPRWSLQCASNAAGCMIADIAQPAYADYGLRLQDADARLRVMAAMLWLRAQQGRMDDAALTRLPASLRSQARPLRLDTKTGMFGTAVYDSAGNGNTRDGMWWVPLPSSRIQPADVSSRSGRR